MLCVQFWQRKSNYQGNVLPQLVGHFLLSLSEISIGVYN